MRIISGKYKGIRLNSPKDNSVRPTTDRIKETVFNILASRYSIEGENVLDMFCGSGALGLEAASRGAKNVVFADGCADSVKLARENIAKTKEKFEVIHGDYKYTAKRLRGEKFGLIFIDPPYKAGLYADIFSRIKENGLIDVGGVVVVEHDGNADLSKYEDSFIIDTRQCGKTYISFYSLKEGQWAE